MRQSRLDAVVGGLDSDQAAQVGFLDGVGIRDPPQRRDLQRFPDGQCIDHLTDGLRQRTETGFDQFDQSPRHGRFADPLPVAVLLLDSGVGDFLLDDVAQVKSVPARQLPQPGSGVGIHWPAQRGRQQLGDLAGRKRLQVKSGELAAAPYLVNFGWNAFAFTDGEHDLGGLALHDLVQDERRQFVEQMDVVDTQHHSGTGRRGCHRVDHAAHQLKTVSAARPGPWRERTEGKFARRRRADRPARFKALGRDRRQRLPHYPALPDACRSADQDPRDARIRYGGDDGSHLLRATDQWPRQPHIGSLERWPRQPGQTQRLPLRVVDVADRLP